MKTINDAEQEYAINKYEGCAGIIEDTLVDFKAGVEFAQQYTSVEDELPEANIQDDEGIFYSEYLLIKVKGFEHPFVGYYVKANDDEFFDFIQRDLEEWIKQEDIISWRLIELIS